MQKLKMEITRTVVVKALRYEPEGRGFNMDKAFFF
jgi:hypothetical protein